MVSLREEVYNRIGDFNELATLPAIAHEIMALTRSNKSSIGEIKKLIEKDPTIASKLLRIANSPFYGYGRKIDNLQKALVLLGLDEVNNIIIGISVYSTFVKLKDNNLFDRNQFWGHSAGTGRIAKILTEQLKFDFGGAEYLAGLVHDIGKLVLDQFFTKEFTEILNLMKDKDIGFHDAEIQLFDITHSELGAILLKNWGFPESVVKSIEFHHTPELADKYKDITSIVHIGDELEKIWGDGFVTRSHEFILFEDNGWNVLQDIKPEISDLDMEKFTFELESELTKSKEIINASENG